MLEYQWISQDMNLFFPGMELLSEKMFHVKHFFGKQVAGLDQLQCFRWFDRIPEKACSWRLDREQKEQLVSFSYEGMG